MNICCTCTDGLIGTCNHVAALLFRTEAAISVSAIDPTSLVFLKNGMNHQIKNTESDVLSFLCQQDQFTTKAIIESVLERKEKVQCKRFFDVMSPSQREHLQNAEKVVI